MSLSTILAEKPVASIEQAVGVMSAIDGALPISDGVRWFNHLYLRVTLAVRTAMGQSHGFQDPAFLGDTRNSRRETINAPLSMV